jgi:hypothetical protein
VAASQFLNDLLQEVTAMVDKNSPMPRVLQWYSRGVVCDDELNLRSHGELMRWVRDGETFVILDHETGEDVTRIFLAHRNDERTEVIDPMK